MIIIVPKWSDSNILSKKLEVLFPEENYNKSITDGSYQCLLKNLMFRQKSTVHFFASTKFYRRFHQFSQFVFQKYLWAVGL